MNQVLTLLLTAGMALTAAAPTAPAADALSLMPDQASAIVGADFQGARGSLLYRELETRMSASSGVDFEDLAASFGMDVREDLDQLTVGSWSEAGKKRSFLAVLEGDLLPIAESEAFGQEYSAAGEHAGVRLFQGTPLENQPGLTLALLGDRLAVAGERRHVTEAIDRSLSNRSAGMAAAAFRAEAMTAAGRGQVWMVVDDPSVGAEAFGGMLGGPMPVVLDSLRAVRFSADLLRGLDVEISGLCESDAAAVSLAAAAKSLLAMAHFSTPATEPELRQVLSSVRVRTAEGRLELSAALTETQVLELLRAAELRGWATNLP